MKLIKLALISLLAIVAMIWLISLLFPNTVIISRAADVNVEADSLKSALLSNEISIQHLLGADGKYIVKTSDIPFYSEGLNATGLSLQKADTIFLQLSTKEKIATQGGVAIYALGKRNTAVQLFYRFYTPWYKPHERWRLVVADKLLGPTMESQLALLKTMAEQ